MLDLDAYLARIGFAGPCDPTLGTLRVIHERHSEAIPFENLDVVLGRPIPLDVASLERKLVHGRRGGYCFEHNLLLTAALRSIGFSVTTLLARVRWQVPEGLMTPQTHMVLRVDVEGRPWLADAGFGGVGLTSPIALDTLEEQSTTLEPRRLVPHGRHWLQQARIGGAWVDVYIVNLDEAYPIDFEVANWFTSTHPNSRFRTNLMAAQAEGTRRLSLHNREFTVRELGHPARKRLLASPADLLEVLDREFLLSFPSETRFPCPGIVWP